MEPYVALSNNAILEGATPQERSLEGQTWATIPGKTQPAPIEDPAKELAPAEVPTEEAAPIEEPTEEVPPTEEPTKEMASTEEPIGEPTAPKATISKPAGEPDLPPVQCKDKRKGEVPHSDFPSWTEVLHPTWSVTSTGEIPLPPGEFLSKDAAARVWGKENLMSKSRRTQTSCTGKFGF